MKKPAILWPLTLLAGTALLLLALSAVLRGATKENQATEQQQMLERLLPGSTVFTAEDYKGDDPNITALFQGESGYVVESTVAGYADDIRLWVGVDDSGAVTGLTVRDMAETWRLGRRAMEDLAFLRQFLGTTGRAAIGEDIAAISGATVTSKAVVRAVNSAAAVVSGADISSNATEWGS